MKTKRVLSLLLIFTMLCCSLFTGTISYAADPLEGNGTERSPYLIRTVTDLYRIPEKPNASYRLMNDIDAGGVNRAPMAEFRGILEGNNCVIRNLNISNSSENEPLGLFSITRYAEITDLKIKDSTLRNSFNTSSGALCGTAYESLFSNCSVENTTVTSSGWSLIGQAGALCGLILDNSYLEYCYSTGGKVTADYCVGGLAARLIDSSMYRCYSTTEVVGNLEVGGLIGMTNGYNYNPSLRECYAINTLTAKLMTVGGLIGRLNTLTYLTDCFSNSTLITRAYSGGLAGGGQRMVATNCYAACEINSEQASENYGLLSDPYQNSNIINCYFDKQLAAITSSDSEARTTRQMQRQSNYENWNFSTIWTIEEGDGYPRLQFSL